MKHSAIIPLFFLTTVPILAQPITDADYRPVRLQEAELGQKLFYDPILSGNKNISCATCHHPKFATGDGLSLGIGEGGIGLGPDRIIDQKNKPEQRIPRHSQSLFNLGAREFTVLFHDGRIEEDASKPSGLRTPMEEEMLEGFDSLLAAQTMFPVLSADEMAGHYSENDVSSAVRSGRITGDGGAWDILSKRVSSISNYSNDFISLYDDINVPSDIRFTDISNAIAAFIEFEWRSDQSVFDAVARGERSLTARETIGFELFNEHCAACHAGKFQTDHDFHAMGVPQFGPGKAARFESHARDVGRMRVTGKSEDIYAFRTPSLRNVTHTSPYGHTGAFKELDEFISAHLKPRNALETYNLLSATLPIMDVNDTWVMDRIEEKTAIINSTSIDQDLTRAEIDDLIIFLETLSDPAVLKGRLGIPESVPSGLSIDR